MRNYLVVANQTIGGAALRKQLAQRIEAGPSAFYVLVPNTSAAHYHAVPAAGGFVPMPSMVTSYGPETDEEATEEARGRLNELVSNIRAQGAEAEGHLGGQHPLDGIEEVLAERTFDEIIISTLPQRVSRWLQADLPHQVERRWNVPVTTVISRR
jgi:cell pole-organizing protein PopZ